MPRIKDTLRAGLFTYGPLWLADGWCITGYGLWDTSIEVVGMLWPISVILFPFLVVPKSSTGKYAISLILIALFIPAILISAQLRLFGFYLAGQRAQPIVEALITYENKNGTVPEAVSDLVPKYLTALPTRTPNIEIISKPEALRTYPGNRWILRASASRGILNWDEFIYLPAQNYEDAREHIERIGKWGYYFE